MFRLRDNKFTWINCSPVELLKKPEYEFDFAVEKLKKMRLKKFNLWINVSDDAGGMQTKSFEEKAEDLSSSFMCEGDLLRLEERLQSHQVD